MYIFVVDCPNSWFCVCVVPGTVTLHCSTMLTFECHMLQHLISLYWYVFMQVRPRFAKDPLFDTITEEVERMRLFKEFMKTVKVGNICGKNN